MSKKETKDLLKMAEKDGEPNQERLLDLARVAETAERYEDMCKFMHQLVVLKSKDNGTLTVEERNLLSVAYKNVVGSKRASWRTLNADPEEMDEELTKGYKGIIEDELTTVIKEILDLLDEHLIKNVKDKKDETEVFYLKMTADYYRYLCEFSDKEEWQKNCEKSYTHAMEIAKGCLSETHPTRLGLALNFSVCYYEILKKPEQACALAKESFDAAIQSLDNLNDANYKDSTLIMQLLRDNLTLWTSENPESGDEQ